MAWTVITDTPQIRTLYEAVTGAASSELSTAGYDSATWFVNDDPAKIQGKADQSSDGTPNSFFPVGTDAGFCKNSVKDGSGGDMGYCRLLPEIIRLRNAADDTALGACYIELRRTATWDRGRG